MRILAEIRFLLVLALLASTLVACATVPMASADADALAKQFPIAADRARVYLVRPSGVAPAVLFRVAIDERTVALMPAHTYLVTELEPGTYTFVAAGHENEDSITLDVEGGKTYFLRIGPRPGWLFARAAIYEIPESEGRPVVRGASLVKGYLP